MITSHSQAPMCPTKCSPNSPHRHPCDASLTLHKNEFCSISQSHGTLKRPTPNCFSCLEEMEFSIPISPLLESSTLEEDLVCTHSRNSSNLTSVTDKDPAVVQYLLLTGRMSLRNRRSILCILNRALKTSVLKHPPATRGIHSRSPRSNLDDPEENTNPLFNTPPHSITLTPCHQHSKAVNPWTPLHQHQDDLTT